MKYENKYNKPRLKIRDVQGLTKVGVVSTSRFGPEIRENKIK